MKRSVDIYGNDSKIFLVNATNFTSKSLTLTLIMLMIQIAEMYLLPLVHGLQTP